jgi:lipase chaperone LimK
MKPSESPLFWLAGILLTGFLGYLFRLRESKKAQKVKDLRSKIDGIFVDMDALEDLAMEYFLKAGGDETLQQDSLKIKTKLKRIATGVNSIHKDLSLLRNQGVSSLTKLMCLRRAVTLEDFDSFDRLAWKASDSRFEKISTSFSELKDVLERIYQDNQ